MINNLKVLYGNELKSNVLLFETFLTLAWARLIILFPFSRVALLLGEKLKETPSNVQVSKELQLKRICHAIEIVSRHTFFESKCLVRAITGMKMLERRGISSTLYLGTTRNESGDMIAHAWLRSGSFFVTGKEGMERFTVVSCFAKDIQGYKGDRYEKKIR